MCEHACGACGGAADAIHEQPTEQPETRHWTAGLDRRELLKRGGLAAAALLLAACAVPGTDLTGGGGSVTLKLSDYPQLANPGGVAQLANYFVENSGGTYFALSRTCPHRGGYIGDLGSEFQCPVHGATFDLQGNWIGGQPTSNMFRVSVKDNGDGTLTVG